MIGWILGLLGFATYPKREYDAYAILGVPSSPPLWEWERWLSDVAPVLDPLLDAARGKTSVNCVQYVGSVPNPKNRLKLGQLGWTEQGHAKWVHGSPVNLTESTNWVFSSAEISSPHPNQCERDDVPPDVYFAISNYRSFQEEESCQKLIGPIVILGIAADLPQATLLEGESACLRLACLTNASVAAYQRRPWGFPDGKILVAYQNVIDQLINQCLLKPGWRDRSSLTFDILDGEWQDILQRTKL